MTVHRNTSGLLGGHHPRAEVLTRGFDNTDEQKVKAMRYVASMSNDREDCARLLDLLGLLPEELCEPKTERNRRRGLRI